MRPVRGRPAVTDKNLVIDVIMKYKDQIIEDNKKIVSKHNAVWETISKEFENRLTPASLYTFVTCNRYKVRDKLIKQSPVSPPSRNCK